MYLSDYWFHSTTADTVDFYLKRQKMWISNCKL